MQACEASNVMAVLVTAIQSAASVVEVERVLGCPQQVRA